MIVKEKQQATSLHKTLHNEVIHGVVTTLVAFIFYLYSQDILLSVVLLMLGMFIDGDHLFDYFIYLFHSRETFSLKEFLKGSYLNKRKKIIFPLHSWEIVIISLFMFVYIPLTLFLVIALALTTHFVIDSITNNVHIFAYFFIYRAFNRFRKEAICRNTMSEDQL